MNNIKNKQTNDYQPSLSVDLAIRKAQMLADIRLFFAKKHVLEITTPILSHYGNTEVFIDSVRALFHQNGQLKTGYLHTSPEFAMKRVLADYQLPIYQICQVFRDNEKGSKHNIEFTMLEWYRPHFTLEQLINELGELLTKVFHRPMPIKRYRYAQTFIDKLNIHPFLADIDTLKQCAIKHDIFVDMGDDKQSWLDLLFSHLIEPSLGFDLPTIILDYPPQTASLAKIESDKDGHLVAKRFELYIDGIEIANAYDELSDGEELLQRFENDNFKRQQLGLNTIPIDINLINCCRDLPPCSGIALGIDRLFMVYGKLDNIQNAITITTDNA
ncbi:MAG: EF-P lysine aminoacylase GenX [Moraxella sp.]|nr:MAG: EF-P lysine aminoacylase GenX [Moraxella sp.]